MHFHPLTHLSDSSLLRELNTLVGRDRAVTASLLAHLAEVDSRRLYLAAAYPSMFAYCVGELRFSEEAAYKRIRVARAGRRFPAILEMLADGRLHLTAVVLLVPVLTQDNAGELIAAAAHRSRAELEELLAERFPRPDLPDAIRALSVPLAVPVSGNDSQPSPGTVRCRNSGSAGALISSALTASVHSDAVLAGDSASAVSALPDGNDATVPGDSSILSPDRARVTPLAPERYAIQCTVSRRTHENLQRARDLLQHQHPDGSLEAVLDRALELLVHELEKRKCAATERPRSPKPQPATNPRHIPAAIKRTVWKRDRGQCTFVSENGRRCEARGHLEFDHEFPVARGGRSTAGNLRLRCRAHNQYQAERVYGSDFMNFKRQAAGERAERSRMARRPHSAHDQTPC